MMTLKTWQRNESAYTSPLGISIRDVKTYLGIRYSLFFKGKYFFFFLVMSSDKHNREMTDHEVWSAVQ